MTGSAHEKALRINLDGQMHGTFAEIGAGQEVARWFFQAGKASATIAKSISAYDMAVSDGLYGPTEHYVSRARLEGMLDREYGDLVKRLGAMRGQKRLLFAFADTAATHTSQRRQAGHGWMGVRFQTESGAPPSEIIIHIEMLDVPTDSQQEAAGLAGVNLLYGAFYHRDDPGYLISALMDGLGRQRLEIDMIRFSGPAFRDVDNRLMSLQLLERGLTDAVMFNERGEVVQPAEVLSRKPVLIERGSFRPLTNVTRDMLDRALEQLQAGTLAPKRAILMEMTLSNLMSGNGIDHADFLARADILGALGYMVMISSYTTFDRVTQYLRNYTREPIGMVVGIPTLRQILDEKYYEDLPGGLLEGLARLFSGPVKLLAYPTIEAGSDVITTVDTVDVASNLRHLYAHLCANGFIDPIRRFDTAHLHVSPSEILAKIKTGDPSWKSMVPDQVARIIAHKRLFGYSEARLGRFHAS
jgi:hypothetical protein